jgi:hypothetical protein
MKVINQKPGYLQSSSKGLSGFTLMALQNKMVSSFLEGFSRRFYLSCSSLARDPSHNLQSFHLRIDSPQRSEYNQGTLAYLPK